MTIILLSGGSGKRLWPLSNDIRSKQFIKLFKDEYGKYESMVQRVYKQIISVDSDVNVVIATGKTQVSAIKNQLGDKVSICIEPCRRDTFPAIVFACAFLKDKIGLDEDECVAVCPVDPFVEKSYYECVKSLETLVESCNANLTLMGIKPTYPSEKYGYIIPENDKFVSRVKSFREKPDRVSAVNYIEQGGLWNSGVFAFKLGYILAKSNEIIGYSDYKKLSENYDVLPKISFDYAVVEKENSIQTIRYAGEWKDVGTWNMMSEVMSDATIGNVTLDETCHNTQVVNELNIPILCMGCKDMVVAVSGDGILVSDKQRSGFMKPFVENIATDVRYAEKSWGNYRVINVQPGSMTIKISLNEGSSLSYHSHELRDESWTVVNGCGTVVIDGKKIPVRKGSVISIPCGVAHSVFALNNMEIIEVQIGEEISKEDKIICNFR